MVDWFVLDIFKMGSWNHIGCTGFNNDINIFSYLSDLSKKVRFLCSCKPCVHIQFWPRIVHMVCYS